MSPLVLFLIALAIFLLKLQNSIAIKRIKVLETELISLNRSHIETLDAMSILVDKVDVICQHQLAHNQKSN